MSNILHTLGDHLRAMLGAPVRLQRLLALEPGLQASLILPVQNIALNRVPEWHRFAAAVPGLSQRGDDLLGCGRDGSSYRSFAAPCRALRNLVSRYEVDQWTCELQDLHGFCSSKSRLTDLESTHAMVEKNSVGWVEFTARRLRENLAHKDVCVAGMNPGSDQFVLHQWDGRLYLANGGGSHHLAEAKYIAAHLEVPVRLQAPLRYYFLDLDAVSELRSTYDIYAITGSSRLANALHGALEAAGVTCLWRPLPQPYEAAQAIFLPRSEGASMRASAAFREAGFADLGEHFQEISGLPTPGLVYKRGPDSALDDVDTDGEYYAPRR